MGRRVTIVDIARAAGVSKSTVSLVLNGSDRVRPQTRDAVRKAMDELDYVYNRNAANLRHPETRIVGMVINDLTNPFYTELAVGIEHVLRTSGYVPFLAHTSESVLRQAEVVRSMAEHGASGLILAPTLDSGAAEINALAELGLPIVLAIRRIKGAKTSLVVADNKAGAAQAADHLVSLGHRRIAFLGGLPQMGVRQDRRDGFVDALRRHGLPAESCLDFESPPTKDGGFHAMSVLLARPDRPTAAFCFNDVVALGAMLALARHGLVPGRDMALTGFDDIVEARHVFPPLTTVSVDVEALGERAAQMLLRLIAHRGAPPETYVGEARLVVRESSGPPLAREGLGPSIRGADAPMPPPQRSAGPDRSRRQA